VKLRTPITMVALLGILLGAAWYGWATITSANDDDEQPQAQTEPGKQQCASSQVFKKGTKIRAKTITVNVFNAGLITGLAGETLDDLVDNGFRRGAAENAPTGVNASNVTIITNTLNSPQVRLVAKQFRGDVRIVVGDAIRPGINVVVGDNFRGVDDGAKRRLVLQRRVKTCTTSGASTESGAS
jgi:LytR cell envelope-related transcriptional attenuator